MKARDVNVGVSGLCVILFSWYALAGNLSFLVFFVSCALTVLLVLLNIYLCIISTNKRLGYGIATLILTLSGLGLSEFSATSHFKNERRWFFSKGKREYEMRIMGMKTIQNAPLNMRTQIGSNPSSFVERKTDGTLMVWFYGRAGLARAGYLYYSGANITTNDSKTNIVLIEGRSNEICMPIVSNWYAF